MFELRTAFSKTPDRFDSLGTGFGNQNYRTAFVAKGLAHLTGQVFFVLVGKKVGAIEEQQKSGRRLPYLGRVKKFNPMPMRTDRLAAFDRILQSAIEDRRGNFLLQLGGHIADGFQEAVQMKTG